MNKARRKALIELAIRIDQIRDEIETIRDEEQEYFDDMPASLQDGERGQTSQDALSILEEIISQLEEASDSLGGV